MCCVGTCWNEALKHHDDCVDSEVIVGIPFLIRQYVGTRVINSDMSCYGNNLMLTSYINVQLVYV